ncbi:hypothetical protein Lal_00049308 [Lupinus albus]|nr:hypothetical protein Lal_00049308 [Lupinus albus]
MELAPPQGLTNSMSNSPTYDELYNAFVEMHEELKKVAKINVDWKRVILLHEKKIVSMQKEINELKLENETLDLIYSSASCMCSTKVIEAPERETCFELKNENDELKNKITKFTFCSQNLNRLLASSKNVGNRTGLGFKHKSKKRPFRKYVASKSQVNNHKIPTCFYCGVHGHTSGSCYIKRHEVPSGKYVWVPKCTPGSVTNKKGPNITWVCLRILRQHRYLDSGCSRHMTGDKSKFLDLTLRDKGYVTYGDNNKGNILGIGRVGNASQAIVDNVLYVEGLVCGNNPGEGDTLLDSCLGERVSLEREMACLGEWNTGLC